MPQIEVSRLTVDELAGLGFVPGGQHPKTVEIPDLPAQGGEKKPQPVTGTLDPKLIPPLSPEVVEAARREASRTGELPAPEKTGPSSDQVARFLVHLLGGNPFRESYEFFGGQVRLTCRTLTAYEDELLARELAQVPAEASAVEALRLYPELSRFLTLESLTLAGRPEIRLDHRGAGSIQASRDQFLQGISQAVHGCVLEGANRFRDLYNSLMARAEDPSFWTAASKG